MTKVSTLLRLLCMMTWATNLLPKQIFFNYPKKKILRDRVGERGEVGAGVETQKNIWGEAGGWGRVPFNEPYAPSLSTIYDGA